MEKSIWKKLYLHFTRDLSFRKLIAIIVGNLILGFGGALLLVSQTGNDPYTAMNLAITDIIPVELGTYQLMVNLVLLIIQICFGRAFIGFGSIVNMFFLGYIIQYSTVFLHMTIGYGTDFSFQKQLIIMGIALVVVSFGLSMYQTANLGVAPYDYLSLGLAEHFKKPYFLFRVLTDGICVLIIVGVVLFGFTDWSNSHLGAGTIFCAFGLGPLVNLFNGFHRSWICKSTKKKGNQSEK